MFIMNGHINSAMHWKRRRDLEGGKAIGIWPRLDDDNEVEDALYVESHAYRGGEFDVYTATPDGDWTHLGEFGTVDAAFTRALDFIEASDHERIGR